MPNFRSGFLQRGMPLGMIGNTVALSANNQFIDVENVALLILTSDSTTSSDRSFSISPVNLNGQTLTIMFSGGNSTTCLLSTSAQPYIRLTSNWTPQENDIIQLVYINNLWIELGRINPASGSSGDYSYVTVEPYSSKWTSNCSVFSFDAGRMAYMIGDFTSTENSNDDPVLTFPEGFLPINGWSKPVVLRRADSSTEFADLGTTGSLAGITPTAQINDKVYTNFVYPI